MGLSIRRATKDRCMRLMLESIDVDSENVAYSLTSRVLGDGGIEISKDVHEGICMKENLKLILESGSPIASMGRDSSNSYDTRAMLALEDKIEVMQLSSDYSENYENILASDHPFSFLKEFPKSKVCVVMSSHCTNEFYALSGKALSQGIPINYTSGNLSSSSFDLDEALRVANSDPRMRVLSVSDNAEEFKPIDLVPYYNNESGTEQCMDILLSLSQDEYDTYTSAFSEGKVNKDRYLFDLDLTNFKKLGVAKFNNYSDSELDGVAPSNPNYLKRIGLSGVSKRANKRSR